jgi:plasmid stability protein
MANLTLTVPDDVLRRARMRALAEGTSVNALFRQYLEAYAGSESLRAAVESFLDVARRSQAASGPGGRAWSREDAHER